MIFPWTCTARFEVFEVGLEDAKVALMELRSSTAVYDDSRLREYYATMKLFLSKAAGYKASIGSPGGTPFVDTTRDIADDLPEPLRSEADAWIDEQVRNKRWSQIAAMVVRWYLKYKLVEDTLDPQQRALSGIYDPLIELLRAGCGYIIDHHGSVIVGSRGMIWYEPRGGG
jgi:hypothetical protein